MSENLFEPLAGSIVESGKLVIKAIKNALNINTLDFRKLFEELDMCNKSKEYPRLYKIINEDYFKIYQFAIPIGLSINDFKEHTEAISHFIGVDNVSIVRNNKLIEIKVLTGVPYEEYNPEIHKAKGYKIPIGIDLDKHKIRCWDLSDGSNANMYIAGSTRCGKSNLLRLIMAILTQKSCADIQFSLINPKRVDLLVMLQIYY